MRADIERAMSGRPVHAAPVLRNDDTVVPAVSPTTVLMREPPQRRRGLAYAMLAVATIAVFVVALIAARGLLGNTSADLHTPDLKHQTYADAQATLIAQGLVVGSVSYVFTGKNNKGEVIGQNPPAGIFLRKGEAVDLTVSNGVRIVSVPNGLVGLTLSQAKSSLVAAGLRLGPVISQNSSAPANQVLGSNPGAGAQVSANSKVSLVVSNSHVRVPDVTGDDPATASAILLQKGFNPEIERSAVYTPAKAGLIVSQTPTGHTFAASGSTVIIYVDKKAPKPKPTATPTVTPTITPTVTPTASITPSP
jgi:beta-lactam-binding protein with PASTA domain